MRSFYIGPHTGDAQKVIMIEGVVTRAEAATLPEYQKEQLRIRYGAGVFGQAAFFSAEQLNRVEGIQELQHRVRSLREISPDADAINARANSHFADMLENLIANYDFSDKRCLTILAWQESCRLRAVFECEAYKAFQTTLQTKMHYEEDPPGETFRRLSKDALRIDDHVKKYADLFPPVPIAYDPWANLNMYDESGQLAEIEWAYMTTETTEPEFQPLMDIFHPSTFDTRVPAPTTPIVEDNEAVFEALKKVRWPKVKEENRRFFTKLRINGS